MAFAAYPTRGAMDDEDLNAAPPGAFTFDNGGGLLGGGSGGGIQGLLGGMGSKFADNSNLITALGMGLMSSPRNNPGENLMQGLATGGTMDARALKAKQDQQQQALARQAMVTALVKTGMDPNEANLMAASPQAVNTWMQQQQNLKTDARDARDFSFRKSEAEANRADRERSYGLQERQFGLQDPQRQLDAANVTDPAERARLLREKSFPKDEQTYDFIKDKEGNINGVFNKRQQRFLTPEELKGINAPDGARTGANPYAVQGAKPATEAQDKAYAYGSRMAQAVPLLDQFESYGMNPTEVMRSKVPGAGNYLVDPQYQQFAQAEKGFINAHLRRDSGAAIAKDEYVKYRNEYIPQPGDSPEVLAQKREARLRATKDMLSGAHPNQKPPPGFENPETAGRGGQVAPAQSGAGTLKSGIPWKVIQ